MSEQFTTEDELLASLENLEQHHYDMVEKSQIVTGGGSSKGQLGKMAPQVYGDSWDDGISRDGTDYKGRGTTASKARGDTTKTSTEAATRERKYAEGEEEDEKNASLATPGEPLRTGGINKKDAEPGEPRVTKGNGMVPPGSLLGAGPASAKRREALVREVGSARARAQAGPPPAPRPRREEPARKSYDDYESGEYYEKGNGTDLTEPTPRVPKPPPPREEPESARSQYRGRTRSPLHGERREIRRSIEGDEYYEDEYTEKGMCPKHGHGCDCVEKNRMMGYGPFSSRPSVGMGLRRSIEIEEDGEIYKGVEISDFIFYLKKSLVDAFVDMEHRVNSRLIQHHNARGDYAKSLAAAVAGIEKSVVVSDEIVTQEEHAPAHIAKSVTVEETAQTLQKSIQVGQDKRQAMLARMNNLLEKGDSSVTALDILKFDNGADISELSPQTQDMLKKAFE